MTAAATTKITSQGSRCGGEFTMKPLPFKKACYEKQSIMAYESAMSLKWQALISHRRYLAKQQQQQQQQQCHPNGFPVCGFEYDSLRRAMMITLPQGEKVKKQVRFAQTATVNTRSVTQDDLENSWYSEEHYRSFETENRHTVACVIQAGGDTSYLHLENFSVMGLEHYTGGRKHMVERRLKTMQHSAMVLEMYDVQRCTGIFDPEMVRRVSERFSQEPIKRALVRAAVSA